MVAKRKKSMTASYEALSGLLRSYEQDREANLLELWEAHEARKKRRQKVLNLLEKAWNEKDRKKRPSFLQFCVVLLDMLAEDGERMDAAIADLLLKKPGNVRKLRCLGNKKLRRVVGV